MIKVFYVPSETGTRNKILDFVSPITGCAEISGATLEQFQAGAYPKAKIGDLETVERESEASFKRAPVIISRERFEDMRDVLPPQQWKHSTDCESFKLQERTYGRITSIFARLGLTYFELSDDCRTPHESIVLACRAILEGGAQ